MIINIKQSMPDEQIALGAYTDRRTNERTLSCTRDFKPNWAMKLASPLFSWRVRQRRRRLRKLKKPLRWGHLYQRRQMTMWTATDAEFVGWKRNNGRKENRTWNRRAEDGSRWSMSGIINGLNVNQIKWHWSLYQMHILDLLQFNKCDNISN